jgi:hypothetical protein
MPATRALLALSLAAPALALVPPVAQTAVARAQTSLRVSYLSEVEDADKQKKWWDKEKGETESSNPRDHSGIGEVDSNYGPVDYVGFVDVEGFDGGDGQVGVVGDGKMKGGEGGMEEFDMSDAIKTRGRMNQLGGKESKLNAKNAWGPRRATRTSSRRRAWCSTTPRRVRTCSPSAASSSRTGATRPSCASRRTTRWPSSRRSRARSTGP